MFAVCDSVRIKPLPPHTVWRLGKVLKPLDWRSYEVQLHSRGVIRRNRRYLRHAPEMSFSDPTDMEISIPSQPEAAGHQPSETVPPPQPRDTRDKDMPATTRTGRTVVQPQRYKDFVLLRR